MGFSGYFKFLLVISGYSKSLTDAGGYLILIKFSGFLKLVESSGFLRYRVESSGFLRYRVDIGRNLSRFLRFRFRVRVVYYKVFLFITGGGK